MTATLLEKQYHSLKALAEAQVEDVLEIDGIGEQTARSLHNYFNDTRTLSLLRQLESHEVSPQQQEFPPNGSLTGLSFLFTGGLETLSRNEAKKLIKENGGQIATSVNKKLTHVVVGTKPGSKLKKAQDLGKNIISEKDFLELIK